jgi:hypothetical protein
MSVFWLIAAVALLVTSRTVTQKIRPDGLGNVVFGLCNLGMLACLGLAFFALMEPSRPTSGYPGQGADTLIFIGKCLGGLLAVIGIGWAMVVVQRGRRLQQETFEGPDVSLSLDRAAGDVVISQRGNLIAHRVPLGHLVLEMKPYDEGDHKRARLVFKMWPSGKEGALLSPEKAAATMTVLADVHTWLNNAKDALAWVRRHPGVELDAGAIRRTWDEACQGLLRYCREQRSATGNPAVELQQFGDGPTLAYVAIEKDGQVLAGMGDHPSLKPVTVPLVPHGNRRVSVTIAGAAVFFDLTDDQVRALQRLQTTGHLRMAETSH